MPLPGPARGRRGLLALLALLPFAGAAQDDTAVLNWQHDDTAEVAEFRIYYGRSPDSLTGVQRVLDPGARTATVDGLADGAWYFAVVAVSPSAVESEPSNLFCIVIPSGSCAAPEAPGRTRDQTESGSPAPDVRVSISNIHPSNGGFDLAISGNGPVTIELAGGLLFDWCSPAGIRGLPAVTPTTPSLGDRDDDGNRRSTVTFTAPLERTRCDGDGADGAAPRFSGAAVTVQQASKPLVEAAGAWSARFP